MIDKARRLGQNWVGLDAMLLLTLLRKVLLWLS